MAYFYLHRDASGLRSVLDALLADGRLHDSKSQAPLSAFFAQVFRLNPALAEEWIQTTRTLDRRGATPLIYALWMAGDAEAAQRLGRRMGLAAKVLAGFDLPPPDLSAMPVAEPAQIDILWGAFMGSGERRYMRRVLDAALTPVDEEDERAVRVHRRADWSLRGNWRKHGVVWMYSLRQVLAREGAQRRRLQAMMRQFRSERRLPHADGAEPGDLRALAVAHRDPEPTGRRRGPSERMPRIESVRQALPGETLEVAVLFSGVVLDEDLAARVSYDLEVTDPLGRPWLRVEDLAAVDGPTPSGWLIHRAEERVVLHFKAGDPAGRYAVRARVRDRVAGVAFEATTWVALSSDFQGAGDDLLGED